MYKIPAGQEKGQVAGGEMTMIEIKRRKLLQMVLKQ